MREVFFGLLGGTLIGATGIGSGSLFIGILGEHFGLGRAFAAAAVLACLALPIFRWTSRALPGGTSVASTAEHA